MSRETALVIIDVQAGMFDPAYPICQGEALLAAIQTLTAKARAADAHVVYVRHGEGPESPLEYGTPGWQVHPSISPLPEDLIIDKRSPDSFHQTPLQAELEARGVKRLVLTGIQTEYCVDTTCRRAFSQGYSVTLVKNGHATWDSSTLSAPQIIAHHNEVLATFAKVIDSSEVEF